MRIRNKLYSAIQTLQGKHKDCQPFAFAFFLVWEAGYRTNAALCPLLPSTWMVILYIYICYIYLKIATVICIIHMYILFVNVSSDIKIAKHMVTGFFSPFSHCCAWKERLYIWVIFFFSTVNSRSSIIFSLSLFGQFSPLQVFAGWGLRVYTMGTWLSMSVVSGQLCAQKLILLFITGKDKEEQNFGKVFPSLNIYHSSSRFRKGKLWVITFYF